MTKDEQTLALALSADKVNYFPGSRQKRFAIEMAQQASQPDPKPITANQRGYLIALALRYRRQVPQSIVELAQGMETEKTP